MDLLDRMLGHDRWTTGRLLELATNLSDEQLDREFDIGHQTVRKTFDHVIWNIEIWSDLMQSRAVRSRPDQEGSIATLIERHEAASDALFTLARHIADKGEWDQTYLDTCDDPPQHKSYGGTILHSTTHGMHHRAQLLYMMRRFGVENLPEGDALGWELSHNVAVPTQPKPAFTIDSAPTESEKQFVDKQLGDYNEAKTKRDDYQPLNLVIRDESNDVIAGLLSVTGWDWLHVRILWTRDDHRGHKLGTKLMQHAEAEARRRGCVGSCLSTFTFQAPEFYEKLGYTDLGQIDDYPAGSTLHFLAKRF